MKKIYLAGGCFWGAEKYLALIKGVTHTEVGYANGFTENPAYEEVYREETGHVETVKVRYDPNQVSLSFLLDLFFDAIDPTTKDRQGGDVGARYRSGVYYIDHSDLEIIQAEIDKLKSNYTNPIVVEVQPLLSYYTAEEYHQNYLNKNPDGYCHIGEDMFKKAREAVETR